MTFLNPAEIAVASSTSRVMKACAEVSAKYVLHCIGSKYMSSDCIKQIQACSSSSISKLNAVVSPKLFTIGGTFNPNRVDKLNLSSGKWEECGEQSIERECSGSVYCRGEIYLVSGDNSTAVGTVSKFNPITDKWMDVASLPNSLRDIACCSHEDQVFTIGGVNSHTYTPCASVYTLENNKWHLHSTLPQARYNHTAVSFRGELYIAGGVCDEESNHSSSVMKYEESSDEWVSVASMVNARSNFKLIELNGALYAVGGDYESTIEMFSDNEWKVVAKFNTPRRNFTATSNGSQIMILGGRDKRNQFLSSFEVYNSVDGQSTEVMNNEVPGDAGFVFGQAIMSPPMVMTW